MNDYSFKDYELIETPMDADEGGGVMLRIAQFPSCFVVMDSSEEAHAELEIVFNEWIAMFRESGDELPPPKKKINSEYTGRFTVRVPKSLHQRLDEIAREEGVSLNQYLASTLSMHIGQQLSSNRTPDRVNFYVNYVHMHAANPDEVHLRDRQSSYEMLRISTLEAN